MHTTTSWGTFHLDHTIFIRGWYGLSRISVKLYSLLNINALKWLATVASAISFLTYRNWLKINIECQHILDFIYFSNEISATFRWYIFFFQENFNRRDLLYFQLMFVQDYKKYFFQKTRPLANNISSKFYTRSKVVDYDIYY